MQSCNPAPPHLGVHLLKIIECSLSTYTKTWRVNEVFWRLFFPTLTCCSCCNLSVLWLAIVTFNEAKVPLKAVSCAVNEFDPTRIRPRLGGLSHLETFTRHNLTPVEVTPPIM